MDVLHFPVLNSAAFVFWSLFILAVAMVHHT